MRVGFRLKVHSRRQIVLPGSRSKTGSVTLAIAQNPLTENALRPLEARNKLAFLFLFPVPAAIRLETLPWDFVPYYRSLPSSFFLSP